MIRDLGTVRPGTVLYVPFHTFDSNDPSASVTITGLAVTDIEIYKDGSTTQRASDNGYTLLDTDGIDFDGTTGIQGFSIALADNSTAGFFSAGSQYWVVVASVTIDAATVNFVACTFRIGYPAAVIDTTIATLASQTSFTLTAGPAEDDALNGMWAVIHDVASAVQCSWVQILDYTGSTKTVTLVAGPTFTAAATDNISVMFPAPLQPTVTGRTLDVSSTGEAGVDWANVGSPTTTLALTGTTIATTQKVDVETIKTNPVVNGGTITFPTTATLASTTNITAGTVTTATNVTTVNGLAANVITATSIAADAITAAKIADGAIDAATFAASAITSTVLAADAITAAKVAADVGTEIGTAVWATTTRELTALDEDNTTIDLNGSAIGSVVGAVGSVTGAVGSVTGNVGGNVVGSVASVVGAVGSVTGLTASDVGAIKTATDKLTFTVANQIDANVLDWKSATAPAMTGDAFARLGAPAGASVSVDVAAVKTDTAAVKAKTDSLTFTAAGQVDANVQRINDVTITGDGQPGTEFGV